MIILVRLIDDVNKVKLERKSPETNMESCRSQENREESDWSGQEVPFH